MYQLYIYNYLTTRIAYAKLRNIYNYNRYTFLVNFAIFNGLLYARLIENVNNLIRIDRYSFNFVFAFRIL